MGSKSQNGATGPTRLTMEVLEEITNNFSEDRIIGEGAYGKVYLGVHENGECAVKILHNNMPGTDDARFEHEFKNVMRMEHHNIVPFVGFCYETNYDLEDYEGDKNFAGTTHRALCFEYMQNGSLRKHLYGKMRNVMDLTGTNVTKLSRAVVRVYYLHGGLEHPIYHLDLKPDNILLDENMVPKLADFGLSNLVGEEQTRITENPIGTLGYLPVEYLHEKIVSKELDIFSLGVVMTEIITGPRGHSRSANMPRQEFLDLVNENWRNRLQATWSSSQLLEACCEQVNICTMIALSCMEMDRDKRPTIKDIICKLNETETVMDEALLRMPGDCQKDDDTNLVKVQAFTRSKAISGANTCNEFPVLVRITAAPWRRVEKMARTGVDVVAVLDISRSMSGYRLDRMKRAMMIVINKLSPNDRLSIVSFETHAHRIMELTYMSYKDREVARFRINELKALNGRDMGAALREGAEILRGRGAENNSNRVGCMMFLSAGECPEIYNEQISPEFVVHTFGLGTDHNPSVMKYIADKTSGTYSSVINDIDKIKDAFELFIKGLACIIMYIFIFFCVIMYVLFF